MDFPPVKAGREIVLDMINYELDTSYLLNQITIGNPVSNNTSGRNTRVQVVLPSQGETETVYALYNRLALNDLFPTPPEFRFQTAFVDKSDLLQSVMTARGVFIEPGDIVDGALNINPNTATFPVNVTVEAQPNSLSFTGQFTIRLQAPVPVTPPDPDPEEDDMHYRAYPSDTGNFVSGGNLINATFGESSSCGAPTICVSSHPTNDEILTIADYTQLTLVSANLYRQQLTQAHEVFDLSLNDISSFNPSQRAYTTLANRTLITALSVGSVAPDGIQLVPTGAAPLLSGEYQLIAEFTHPGFTRPIFFYQRIFT